MTRTEAIAKATHSYIGKRKTCGCIVSCVVDDGHAAKDVANMIRHDLIVERVPLGHFRDGTVKFGCEHQRAAKNAQAQLFK
jgi:hypothetical protein